MKIFQNCKVKGRVLFSEVFSIEYIFKGRFRCGGKLKYSTLCLTWMFFMYRSCMSDDSYFSMTREVCVVSVLPLKNVPGRWKASPVISMTTLGGMW